MNESVLQYWNRMKQSWSNFNKSQKIMLLAIVGFLLISVPSLIYYFSRTEYALAFTDLQPNDAAAITGYLNSSNIPYVLSDDGKSISVPRSQVASVKISVVDQGLNRNGSIGYEALGENSMFGSTDREFDVKKLSMLQGELERMLNSFASVAGSKVMITLPENSVFLSDAGKEQSSAAVVLQLKPGFSLDQQKIDTMYQLVSKSVKDLPVDNITISEQNGDLLPFSKSNSGFSSTVTAASEQFKIKKQFEQDIQRNVMNILGKVLGQGKVVPVVVASLNFDQKKSVQNLVEPVVDNEGIAISVQEIQKNYTSDGSSAGGVPGTGETDVPNYPGEAGSGKTTSEEIQKTINSEVNRIHNEIESSPYYINDLTISVGVEPPDKNNPDSLTPETENSIRELLKNVVSASLANSGKQWTDAELQAKVTVFKHVFAEPVQVDAAGKTNWLMYGAGALALLIGAGAGFFISRRRRKTAEEVMEPVVLKPEYPTIDLEAETSEQQVRKQLEMLAKKKPEEFVNLLRTWLVEE